MILLMLLLGAVVRVQQQMWFSGPDGTSVPKGALRICEEHGLPNVGNMRCDELSYLSPTSLQ